MPYIQYKALDTNTDLDSIPNSLEALVGSSSSFLTSQDSVNFIYKILDKNLEARYSNEIYQRHYNLNVRLLHLLRMDAEIRFIKIESELFFKNLLLIDSDLPEITSQLLLKKYLTRESSIYTLIKLLEESNPLEYPIETFYKYKISKMLRDMALGMSSKIIWNGKFNTSGITLVIRDDGERIYYRVYDIQQLITYLIKNIYLSTPANRGHSKPMEGTENLGWLYEENGELFIKLCFQLDFQTS